MSDIEQVKYNKITCTACGGTFHADLTAFDLGKVFTEVIRETDMPVQPEQKAVFGVELHQIDPAWTSLARLDLKFYYTVRDLCQELGYKMDKTAPTELRLTVKAVKRQLEFLMEIPFSDIQRANRHDVMYNRLYETVRSTYGSSNEIMAEIEMLIRNLATCREDMVILTVPVFIVLDKDIDGNEMASRLQYYVNNEKRELSSRVCPYCGASMDWLAGYRNEIVIGLAGLPRVGKTAFIASLVHQLGKLGKDNFISIKDNESESLAKFEKEIVAEYEKGNTIYKTEVENADTIPLVYLPLKIGGKEYNFVFVDMPGEIYNGDSKGLDFISNKRVILKSADVVWCFIEPSMIDKRYRNVNIEPKEESADRQLSDLTHILDIVYTEKIPASIIVTQSDLIDKYDSKYGLYRPEVNVMEDYLRDNTLDLTKTNEFVDDTKKFIDQMTNFSLSIEGVFDGFSMFAAASYGFDVSNQVILSNNKIHPSMVELPFLWTLAKLNLIETTKVRMDTVLFGLGGVKEKAEIVTDPNEFYVGK